MKVYFRAATAGTVTPSNEVNEGAEDGGGGGEEDSFEVDDLYLGKAKPNRVSIPINK